MADTKVASVVLGLFRGPRSGKLKLKQEAPVAANKERVFSVVPFTPGDKGAISLLKRARKAKAERPDILWDDPTGGDDAMLVNLWIGRKQYRTASSGYQSGKVSFWFSVDALKPGFRPAQDEAI